jgi:hypothetical protein
VWKDYLKAMQSADEQNAWWDLCRQAVAEEDPVKFLATTMQITKFLARKQQRLDAAYDAAFDEAYVQEARQAQRKSELN